MRDFDQKCVNEVLRHSREIFGLERQGKKPEQIWKDVGLSRSMSFKAFFQAWYFPMEYTMPFTGETSDTAGRRTLSSSQP